MFFCADNLLDTIGQYTGHTLTAEEEAENHEVDRIANHRRSADDHWAPTTSNSVTYVRCVFDRLRAFNFVALDRGHNYGGLALEIKTTIAATDFSGAHTVVSDVVVPTVSAPAGLHAGGWVHTREGADLLLLDTPAAGMAVEFAFDDMGAGLKPQMVGMQAGLGVTVERDEELPTTDRTVTLSYVERMSASGWIGRGRRSRVRAGAIRYNTPHAYEYELTALALTMDLYSDGYPMWIAHDEAGRGDLAFLAAMPPGALDWGFSSSTGWRAATIPFREHQAVTR